MKGCPTLSWELLNNVVKLINIVVFSMEFETGGAPGEGTLGACAPPAFHTLAKDMSLNRGATRFTLLGL